MDATGIALSADNHTRSRPRRLAGQLGATVALAAVTVTTTGPVAEAQSYTVKRGDTVWQLAQRTGTTAQAIINANGLGSGSLIFPGQQLQIPTGSSTSRTASAGVRYTVRAGDTVSEIAARTGSTTKAIIAANGLNSAGFIRIGQTLTIPGTGGTSAPSTSSGSRYTVRAGDTVSGIAARTGSTTKAIIAANGLNSAGFIRIGQTLTIPGTGGNLVPDSFGGYTYPKSTVQAANMNKAILNARAVPTRAQMQSKVAATARRMGVDPALAQAIAYQESGFNQRAVSPANAIGVMQVIPSSGQWASQLVGRHLDLLDPDDNVTAGVAILRQLTRTAPNQSTAIAGYYQGLSSVTRNGMYSDTRRYVATVQTLMARFR